MRARRCIGRIHDDIDDQLKAQLIEDQAPIHRDVYICAEACCADPLARDDDSDVADESDEDLDEASEGEDSDEDSDEEYDDDGDENEESDGSVRVPLKRKLKPQQKKRKRRKRSCLVNLHVGTSIIFENCILI